MTNIFLLLFAALLCGGLFWYVNRKRQENIDILQLVLGVAEVGDPSLDGHSQNVLRLTMLLYDFLPWQYRFQINRWKLSYAALLLDLGKFGVPAEIRNKEGKLTEEEWKMMKRHPEHGMHLMETVPALHTIGKWVLYHHEHVDGSGYYHLKGDQIPLASRILAVTDTYSAITMVRPYRASRPYEEAITELKMVADKQLDAKIVKYFCDIPPKRINERIYEVQQRMELYTEKINPEGVKGGYYGEQK